jgi:hypothetical protein
MRMDVTSIRGGPASLPLHLVMDVGLIGCLKKASHSNLQRRLLADLCFLTVCPCLLLHTRRVMARAVLYVLVIVQSRAECEIFEPFMALDVNIYAFPTECLGALAG